VTAVLLFPNETTFCNVPGVCSGPLGPVPVTSGTPPEFPAGTLAFDGSLAISGSQIIWTATLAATYALGTASGGAGAFNGIDVFFTGAPAITNVTVDPASTILPVPFSGPPASSASGVSFNANSVLFNLAGDTVLVNQKLILNVQTSASAVPEPASGVLLSTALLVLGGVAFIRRSLKPTINLKEERLNGNTSGRIFLSLGRWAPVSTKLHSFKECK
jgi:hypothetical protein